MNLGEATRISRTRSLRADAGDPEAVSRRVSKTGTGDDDPTLIDETAA